MYSYIVNDCLYYLPIVDIETIHNTMKYINKLRFLGNIILKLIDIFS